MIRRIVLSVLVLALMVSMPAWAKDSPSKGGGQSRRPPQAGLVAGGVYDEKAAELERQLYIKRAELVALLAAPEVDGEKAAVLHKEMVDAMVLLAQRRFEMAMEYKKKTPTWQPGFGKASGWEAGCLDSTGIW